MLEYWYMLPACMVIATIAMAAGIGGATFYVPFILIVLKVPISSAVAIGIFVEVFGFAAGVYNYARAGQIDYKLAKKLLRWALSFTIIGVFLNRLIEPTIVEYVLILALMIFSTQILFAKHKKISGPKKEYEFRGGLIAGIGGILLGFVSSGLGESNEYNLLVRYRRSPAVVAGTSVLIVSVSALAATIVQVGFILQGDGLGSIEIYKMLIVYSVIGAVIGAKIGQLLVQRINRDKFRIFVSLLLYAVALSVLAKVLLLD